MLEKDKETWSAWHKGFRNKRKVGQEQLHYITTCRAYFAATYPPKECPSKMKLLKFLALRHSSKESMNHASVSAISHI